MPLANDQQYTRRSSSGSTRSQQSRHVDDLMDGQSSSPMNYKAHGQLLELAKDVHMATYERKYTYPADDPPPSSSQRRQYSQQHHYQRRSTMGDPPSASASSTCNSKHQHHGGNKAVMSYKSRNSHCPSLGSSQQDTESTYPSSAAGQSMNSRRYSRCNPPPPPRRRGGCETRGIIDSQNTSRSSSVDAYHYIEKNGRVSHDNDRSYNARSRRRRSLSADDNYRCKGRNDRLDGQHETRLVFQNDRKDTRSSQDGSGRRQQQRRRRNPSNNGYYDDSSAATLDDSSSTVGTRSTSNNTRMSNGGEFGQSLSFVEDEDVEYGTLPFGYSPKASRDRTHDYNPASASTATKSPRLKLYYKQNVAPFWKITIAQVLCMVYILVFTFAEAPLGMTDPVSGHIIDSTSAENTSNGVIYVNGSYRPVVAVGDWQKICLAVSRMSAFSMYPMLVAVFITKMKAIQTFFSNTPLSMYLGVIKESHDYHAHAGKYIAFDVWVHTVFHLLRWISQGNVTLLWTSAAGLTGLITVALTPLITLPMMYYKDKLRYEIRKGLHYLFYVFAVAMCFHVPPNAVPNGGFIAPILGTCIVIYTLDAIYVYMFMTEKIETTAFHVLSSGVRISMPVSERFQKHAEQRAGYAYILIPWINDKQWHPFSLFEDPSDPSIQQMFLMNAGDWTNDVHAALSRDTTRPCWIKGPFPSPYSHASMYDNQILVASGIGITPALAAICAYKSSRRINLIWAVRDPEMLEFFLEHMYLDHDGWNLIFYTGKDKLAPTIEKSNTDMNIRMIKGRPNLHSLIPNIVYGNESDSPTFSLWEKSEEQITSVKLLDEHVMASWGMMYCGGSKEVLKSLREISIDYNIDLHIDSFAW